MDQRIGLKPGTELPFPGMACVIERCVGCGSNAIVYEGAYPDALNPSLRHRVLIKELFPYDAGGHIWRGEKQQICMDGLGEAVWKLHRRSFERGNDVHLQMLSQMPEQTGGNLNTFSLNQTLYTLLDYSGGRSLDRELQSKPRQTLGTAATRVSKLLTVLEAFHERGFLHLDISLDNVLLVGEGKAERVLLIDYNSVHTRQELLDGGDVYFSAKEGFTAPEIRTNMARAIAECTDLFSVACVFYALLTGRPPAPEELTRRHPPDAADSPLLADVPPTVKTQVRRILRRGLCVLPDRRYRSCAEMRRDVEELENRLDGVGITHAALWEAGKRSIQRLTRQNPSLAYVERDAELYPLRIRPENGESMPAQAFVESLAASALLLGDGGMGKSTALLRAALEGGSRYSPAQPAVMYLPLPGWKRGENHFILNQVLKELRFDARTKTVEDARHALLSLLGEKRNGRATLLLLLDGLNETVGDNAALLEEIEALSALPGLRMIVASRTAPENLTLYRAFMARLEETDVSEVLARSCLLLPESAGMRKLLRTPMMLSLFVQTAKDTGNQVLCQSERELLRGYLDALCEKAAREAGRPADYRVEAAVKLVLPAIAREIERQGHPLDDLALHRTVRRCHALLRGNRFSGAFPQWIGHSREALGEAVDSAEAWHGEIVQTILWQRLGLLVRDANGCYHVLHQILRDYLAGCWAENKRRLRLRRVRVGVAAGLALMLLACGGLFVWELWLRPRPYDERLSAMALDAATIQFINCGLQYEAMTAMLAGEMEPRTCADLVAAHGEGISRSARLAIEQMQEGDGEVIPWSGQPFDFESAGMLLALPGERADAYATYIRAYALVSGADEDGFSEALCELLEADADIAWLLEQIVCLPHVDGMSEAQRLSYDTGLLSLPAAQETRAVDVSRGLSYALEKAGERRRRAQNELEQRAVMHDPAIGREAE